MEPKKLTTTVELTAEDLATNDLTEVVRKRFQEAGREDFKQLAEAFQRPMTGRGPFGKAFEKANLSDGDPSSKRPMLRTEETIYFTLATSAKDSTTKIIEHGAEDTIYVHDNLKDLLDGMAYDLWCDGKTWLPDTDAEEDKRRFRVTMVLEEVTH